MSVYLDTSVVMSFFLEDIHADRVRHWASSRPEIVISDWSMTEFTSALSLILRRGDLTEQERAAAERTFDRWAAGLVVLEIDRERFEEARALMRMHRRLRAPDALHLAVVLHAGLSLASLDVDMVEAARAEGVRLVDL